MKLTKYKDFIIINNSIWFDRDDYKECRSFQIFKSKDQVIEFIDNFHKKYELINDRYILKKG